MRKFGIVIGIIISALRVSIMLTPLRVYFIIGWIVGCVLLCNGASMLITGLASKDRDVARCTIGAATALLGGVLIVTDVRQMLTQMIVVYIISGGIMMTGLIECVIGYFQVKNNQPAVPTLILGGLSFTVGLIGLIYHDMTVIIIGLVIGFYITRIGVGIFKMAKAMDKPIVVKASELRISQVDY